MIVYTNRCLSCTDKYKWLKLKQFARSNRLSIEVRKVTLNKEWAIEADNYEIPLPFVVHNGVALSLEEPLEGII